MARIKNISALQLTGVREAVGFINGSPIEKKATRNGSVSPYYSALMMATMRALVAGKKEGQETVSLRVEDEPAAAWLIKVMTSGYSFGVAGVFARFMADKAFRLYHTEKGAKKIYVHRPQMKLFESAE